MGTRYSSRRKKRVDKERHEKHKKLLDKRNRKHILAFRTGKLNHPTSEDISKLTLRSHVWGAGDRFFKLAHEYYGDSKLWWVIAWFNQKPTEAHVEKGDTIKIPLPIDKVFAILEV